MTDLSKFRGIAESLFSGKCDVYEYKGNTKGLIKMQEIKVLEDVPCRLSYRNNYNNTRNKASGYSNNEDVSSAKQTVVLFTAPGIDIKAGSKVIITQNNRTIAYNSSGEPVVYQTHQEIALELFKGWC